VGGGGRRILRLAGRRADIVGLNANLGAGGVGQGGVLDVSWERMLEKVGWAREGAESAGRDPDEVELSMGNWLLHVTESRSAAEELVSKMASRLGVDAVWLEAAPGVLVGSRARVTDKLHELRDRLGISYFQLHAGPHSVDLGPVAPVVAALSGT
jgi:alkanesulfonate monooxygenase SsuD/methylene tetrahydromethanopterin reductase-like flavin-dependent oxidoreductase (luciferase family)